MLVTPALHMVKSYSRMELILGSSRQDVGVGWPPEDRWFSKIRQFSGICSLDQIQPDRVLCVGINVGRVANVFWTKFAQMQKYQQCFETYFESLKLMSLYFYWKENELQKVGTHLPVIGSSTGFPWKNWKIIWHFIWHFIGNLLGQNSWRSSCIPKKLPEQLPSNRREQDAISW